LHREAFVASDHEAVDPLRRVIGIESDTFGSFEKRGQDHACFHPCEGCSDTVVHSASEADVVTRGRSFEIDLIRVIELGGVSVR
jgi:hypothetical protein